MSAVPSEMTEAMLQAAHESAYATRGLDWRSAERARWAAITAAMPKQDDSTRLVWAMNHMGLGSTHSEFIAHVLSVGGVGDLADCRVFVDAQMQKEPTVPAQRRGHHTQERDMATHTPGPWTLHPTALHPAVRSVGTPDAGARRICTVGSMNGNPVDKANARLIAAAPELLEALTRLSAQCERLRLPEQRQTDAEANALAVIAKATQ